MTPEFTTALVRGLGHAGIVGAISFFTLWADPNISTRTLVSGAMLPALTVLGTRWFGEGFLDTRKAGNGGSKMPCLAWLMFGALFLTGCSSTNLAEVIQAAGADQATVCARVTSVYGTLTYLRSNIHGGDVSCDTLTVKSAPPATSVELPMTIKPSFTIAPK